MREIASFTFYMFASLLWILCLVVVILGALFVIRIELMETIGVDIREVIKNRYDKQSGSYWKSDKRN